MKKDGENRRITSSKDMPANRVKRVEAIKQRSHENESANLLESVERGAAKAATEQKARERGAVNARLDATEQGFRKLAESAKQRKSERVEKGFDELAASALKRHANSAQVQDGHVAKLAKQKQKSSDSKGRS